MIVRRDTLAFVRKVDLCVVGGGIVGLAAAYRATLERPGLSVAVLEKEERLAAHQSGNNSGVVHAGVYYAPGSLRARLTRTGRDELAAFAAEHRVPYRVCGKVLVATDMSELPRLEALEERARANGLRDVATIGPEELEEVEPHVTGVRALHVPETAVTDFAAVARALASEVRAAGGEVHVGTEVMGLAREASGWRVVTSRGALHAERAIVCAGLWSDRVAVLAGGRGGPGVVPFRGGYRLLRPAATPLVRALIYPVPDPSMPFLGVHFTRRVDDEVWVGPSATLALSRSGYRLHDVDPRDLWQVLRHPGFRKLARANAGFGLGEFWREVSKPAFARVCRRYVPELRAADLGERRSGVRAQALEADGSLVDDFLFDQEDGLLVVRNAPSPAATACLAIGREIVARAFAD